MPRGGLAGTLIVTPGQAAANASRSGCSHASQGFQASTP